MTLDQYEQIFNTTQNALFIVEVLPNGRFTYLATNTYHQEHTGISLERIIGKTPQDLLGQQLGTVVSDRYQSCLNTAGPVTYQETLPLESGTKTWETTLTPIHQEGQNPWIVGSSHDISELIRIQEQITHQQESIEHILDSLPVSIFLADLDGKIKYANGTFRQLCSNQKLDCLDRSFYSIFQVNHDLYNQQTPKNISTQIILPNTTKVGSFLLTLTDFIYPDTGMSGILGIVEDKTNEALNSQQLHAVENRFRSMVQNIPGAVFRMTDDQDWSFIYVSPGITELLGYSPNDFYTKKSEGLLSFVLPQWRDSVVSELRYALRNDLPITLDFQAQTTRQETRWLQLRGKRILGLPGTLITFDGAIFDITEAKEYQHNLEQAREQAEIASKTKSEFLANMSHELRTPLNSVVGFSDLLLTTGLQGVEYQYAKSVNSSAKLLLQIISDILDFSKIEAGKLELSPTPTDLKQLVFDVQELFQEQIANKGLDFKVTLSETLPSWVEVDGLRLEQVLINLVCNALKFTQQGSIELRVFSGVENQSQRRITFYVKDTGIGIFPEEQNRLFQPFTQGDSSVTRKYGGTGLGLVISQNIVQAMGGIIQLTSEPGQGTEFSFSLLLDQVYKTPITKVPELTNHPKPKSANSAQSHSNPDTSNGNRKKPQVSILIVDDVPINLLLAKSLVKKVMDPVAIYEATNGQDALELAISHDFDLILMDVQMPGKDGLTTTKEILATKTVPIIALTAGVMTEERQKCLDAGMKGFLSKPVGLKEMKQMLSEQGFFVV